MMKTFSASLCCLVFTLLCLEAAGEDKETEKKKKTYASAAADCDRAISGKKSSLAESYSSEVWGLKQRFQNDGNLENALAADKEWSRSIRREPLTPEDLVESPKELRALQDAYVDRYEQVEQAVAAGFVRDLEREATELAQAGNLTDGRVLQQEIDKIRRLYLSGANSKAATTNNRRKKEEQNADPKDPVAACEEAIRQKRVAFQAQYVGELEALEKSFQAKGELENLFAAKAERKRFLETPLMAKENVVETPEMLRELQEKYRELQQTVVSSVAEDFTSRLEAMKRLRTQEGRLDEATAVKAAAEKIRQTFLSDHGADVVGWKDITSSMKGGKRRGDVILLQEQTAYGSGCTSAKNYTPPLEIEYLCSTSKDDIRFRYACTQMIFSWSDRPSELRIDGGPADGRHVSQAGFVPPNQLLTIRQVVLPDEMSVYVDDKLRASWKADFSRVNEPIGVYAASFSEIQLRRIRVKSLPKSERR